MRHSGPNYNDTTMQGYIQKIKSLPILSSEEEYTLAKDWKENQNSAAIDKIVNAHLKLVAKIASGYRGYGLCFSELVAEGNIGIMNAIKHFDPDKGFRFSTYAAWWIRARIQEYVLQSWSMVKIGTTAAQKKLFFNLRRMKEDLREEQESDFLTPENIKMIAKKLKVKPEEVIMMNRRMSGKDGSLNAPLGSSSDESTGEWIDWVADETQSHDIKMAQHSELSAQKNLFEKAFKTLSEREHKIITARRLHEPPQTLEAIAANMGISKERVRQIEASTMEKLKKRIKNMA